MDPRIPHAVRIPHIVKNKFQPEIHTGIIQGVSNGLHYLAISIGHPLAHWMEQVYKYRLEVNNLKTQLLGM